MGFALSGPRILKLTLYPKEINGINWFLVNSEKLEVGLIMGPLLEGTIKSLLSVRPSFYQFGIFLGYSSLIFYDFWYNGSQLEYLKTDRALFWENSFLTKFG